MCDFLSVLINPDCDEELKIYAGNLTSHSQTAEIHKLKAGSYREVEWTGDDENKLTVRVESGDHGPNWYRACILARFKTRDSLIDWCLKNANTGGGLYLGGTQVKEIPAGLKVGGSLYLSGTQVKEIPAGLKVGGGLYLSRTQVKEIPAGLKVGGGLYLGHTQVKKIPAGLKVGGDLDLSYTQVKKIPAGLKVGGDLYLSGTQVKRESVPADLLGRCYW